MDDTELTTVPPGIFRYQNTPIFVSWPQVHGDKWFIWGPADKLPLNTAVEVWRYTSNSFEGVEVLEWIAQRTVRKRDNTQVLFILATFDRIMEEE